MVHKMQRMFGSGAVWHLLGDAGADIEKRRKINKFQEVSFHE
jgi:hypothetical protein